MNKSTLAIAIAALTCISNAHSAPIYVNFTGGATPESGLVGPGGGSGTSWNQFAGPNSPGTLVDSTGAATSVTISSNFDLPNTFDSPVIGLTMLRGSMTNFGKGVDNTNVTINGLEAGGFYNIWLVTLRNQSYGSNGTEQYAGWWSTTNTTTSPSNQLVDARGASINTTTFVAGYNYVLFQNVQANGSGQIVFTGVAGPLLDGSNNNHRLGLNGLQIEKTTPPVIGAVDNAMSSVEASPATVFANGVLTSTVTVTLRDSEGDAVPGKNVTLANTGGPHAAIITPLTAVATNTAGQATFTVKSSSPGIEVFTATDVTDSLTLTDTASVEFIEVGVLTNAAQSTLTASPPSVLADGSSTSTITVTLRDANGFAVSGNNVTLANSGGAQAATIIPPGAVISNASGQAVFSVRSSTIGAEEFTATDTTDSVVVTQVANVGFIDPNAPKLINVNFTAGTAVTQSSLEGPGGGVNTIWNQYPGADSTGTVLDSLGGASTVQIDTNFGLTALDAPTPLTMLRGSMTNFGKGVDDTNVTISGLAAGGYYDVWLVTLRNQPFGSDGTEQYVGWWSTTNTTTSPGHQLVDARGATINTTTFVEGYNYVLFKNVEADETGKIVFTGIAGDLLDGSNNNHRLGLNGLQIKEADPPLATILTFGIPGATGVINDTAKTITLAVPYGTNPATVAPTFTLTSGTCNQTSGSPPSPSFASANPVHYIVTDTSTDPDTVNDYTVTLVGSLVINLGASPAGTTIAGGSYIGTGPTNMPLPTLPAGSILRSIAVNAKLEATDNENYANDLTILLDPTPGTPGGDFSLGITNPDPAVNFGPPTKVLSWSSVNNGASTSLTETKTATDWASVAPINLATTGLFLGNSWGGPTLGGTWSGTITLTYDIVPSGSDYSTWASRYLPADVSNPGADNDGDGMTNRQEHAFGLNPVSGSSVNPITVPLNPTASTFSYTRRASSGLSYTIWTSTNLQTWTRDNGAIQTAGATNGNGVQTVAVTLTATPVAGKLFVRVHAN